MAARIRFATESDVEAILALKCAVFPNLTLENERRRWRWQFQSNPAYLSSLPLAAVAEDSARIVGCYAFVPYRVKLGSELGTACAGIDLAVHPDARGQGLAEQLTAIHWREGFCDFPFATGLNSASQHLFTRHGGVLLGGPDETTAHAKFLDENSATSDATPCNEGFEDELWSSLAPSLTLSLVKDRAYLDWRYRRFPFQPAHILTRRDSDGRAAALCVVQADPEHGRGYLLELLLTESGTRLLTDLLDEAIAVARKDLPDLRALFVSTRSARDRALLEAAGWPALPGPHPTFIGKVHRSGLDVRAWQTSLGDGDQLFQVGASV